MTVHIMVGDALSQLATQPGGSVHCVVTSPPVLESPSVQGRPWHDRVWSRLSTAEQRGTHCGGVKRGHRRLRACPRSPREGPARDAACPQQADAAAWKRWGNFAWTGSNEVNSPMGSPMDSGIMTIREVAEYLKLTEKTAYRHAADGKIPGFKVGGAWRFRRGEIDKWIERQSAEQENQGEK